MKMANARAPTEDDLKKDSNETWRTVEDMKKQIVSLKLHVDHVNKNLENLYANLSLLTSQSISEAEHDEVQISLMNNPVCQNKDHTETNSVSHIHRESISEDKVDSVFKDKNDPVFEDEGDPVFKGKDDPVLQEEEMHPIHQDKNNPNVDAMFEDNTECVASRLVGFQNKHQHEEASTEQETVGETVTALAEVTLLCTDRNVSEENCNGTDKLADNKNCKEISEVNDDYIFCDNCHKAWEGDCPKHGPLIFISDVPVVSSTGDNSYAKKTILPNLTVATSKINGAGRGVWTKCVIPARIRFGPYVGARGQQTENKGYCWQVMKNKKAECYIDGSDESRSNWMRYVNCARNRSEQNLTVYQYKGEIYFRTFTDIPSKTELLVWYDIEDPCSSAVPSIAPCIMLEVNNSNAIMKNTHVPETQVNMELMDNNHLVPLNGYFKEVKDIHEELNETVEEIFTKNEAVQAVHLNSMMKIALRLFAEYRSTNCFGQECNLFKKVESARKYPRRNVPVKKYIDIDEPEDDDYIFCDACQMEWEGDCPKHGPLLAMTDTPVVCTNKDKSYAVKTLPPQLAVATSKITGAGKGVWTRCAIPARIRFGPYVGVITRRPKLQDYCWEIKKRKKPVHCVDAYNQKCSNWMRYVNCARHRKEWNTIAYQYKGQIFYRTFNTIPANTELLIWYGPKYGICLGITMEKFKNPLRPSILDNIFRCAGCRAEFKSPLELESHYRQCQKSTRLKLSKYDATTRVDATNNENDIGNNVNKTGAINITSTTTTATTDTTTTTTTNITAADTVTTSTAAVAGVMSETSLLLSTNDNNNNYIVHSKHTEMTKEKCINKTSDTKKTAKLENCKMSIILQNDSNQLQYCSDACKLSEDKSYGCIQNQIQADSSGLAYSTVITTAVATTSTTNTGTTATATGMATQRKVFTLTNDNNCITQRKQTKISDVEFINVTSDTNETTKLGNSMSVTSQNDHKQFQYYYDMCNLSEAKSTECIQNQIEPNSSGLDYTNVITSAAATTSTTMTTTTGEVTEIDVLTETNNINNNCIIHWKHAEIGEEEFINKTIDTNEIAESENDMTLISQNDSKQFQYCSDECNLSDERGVQNLIEADSSELDYTTVIIASASELVTETNESVDTNNNSIFFLKHTEMTEEESINKTIDTNEIAELENDMTLISQNDSKQFQCYSDVCNLSEDKSYGFIQNQVDADSSELDYTTVVTAAASELVTETDVLTETNNNFIIRLKHAEMTEENSMHLNLQNDSNQFQYFSGVCNLSKGKSYGYLQNQIEANSSEVDCTAVISDAAAQLATQINVSTEANNINNNSIVDTKHDEITAEEFINATSDTNEETTKLENSMNLTVQNDSKQFQYYSDVCNLSKYESRGYLQNQIEANTSELDYTTVITGDNTAIATAETYVSTGTNNNDNCKYVEMDDKGYKNKTSDKNETARLETCMSLISQNDNKQFCYSSDVRNHLSKGKSYECIQNQFEANSNGFDYSTFVMDDTTTSTAGINTTGAATEKNISAPSSQNKCIFYWKHAEMTQEEVINETHEIHRTAEFEDNMSVISQKQFQRCSHLSDVCEPKSYNHIDANSSVLDYTTVITAATSATVTTTAATAESVVTTINNNSSNKKSSKNTFCKTLMKDTQEKLKVNETFKSEKNDMSVRKKNECHLCGSQFKSYRCYEKHECFQRKKQQKDCYTSVTCCNESQLHVNSLQQQKLAQHTVDKEPYVYEISGDKLTQPSKLKEHKQNHTKGEKQSYRSDSLSESSPHVDSLQEHKLEQSTVEKEPYVCEICGDKFTLLSKLKRRKQRHTRENNSYTSDSCLSKPSPHVDSLQEHKREQSMVEKEPYVCEKCGDKFTRLSKLKRRKQRHTREKNSYTSGSCLSKPSPHVDSLQEHKREQSVVEKELYVCEICGDKFTRLSKLKRHKQSHARGEKQLCCSFCDNKCIQHVTKSQSIKKPAKRRRREE